MKIKIEIKSVSGKVLFELEKENNTINLIKNEFFSILIKTIINFS